MNLIRYGRNDDNQIHFPLNYQIGISGGGANIGFGYGFAGGPEGLIDGPFQPNGLGLRLHMYKPWKLISKESFIKYSKVYLGIETTITFMFIGVDLSYMFPHDFYFKNSYFSFGIGIGY